MAKYQHQVRVSIAGGAILNVCKHEQVLERVAVRAEDRVNRNIFCALTNPRRAL